MCGEKIAQRLEGHEYSMARRRLPCRWSRRGVGVGGLVIGRQDFLLHPLSRLTIISVYDERLCSGKVAIRVCAYRPRLVRHGVVWASADDAILFKDLTLRPNRRGRGLRMGTERREELAIVRQLNRMVDQFNRRAASRDVSTAPVLPRVWAAFPSGLAQALTASGPEFEQLVGRFRLAPAAMQAKFTRRLDSLTLLPLDWVSDRLADCVEVYADLEDVPPLQVFSYRCREDLAGYQGASSYDFYANRFRARYEPRPAKVAVA